METNLIFFILYFTASSVGEEDVQIKCTTKQEKFYLKASFEIAQHNISFLKYYSIQERTAWTEWKTLSDCRQSVWNQTLSVKCQQTWNLKTSFETFKLQIWNNYTNEMIPIKKIWAPRKEYFFCFTDHNPKILNISGENKKITLRYSTNSWDLFYIRYNSITVSTQNRVVYGVNTTDYCDSATGCFKTITNLSHCTTYTVCISQYYIQLLHPYTKCKKETTYCEKNKYSGVKILIPTTIGGLCVILGSIIVTFFVCKHRKRRASRELYFSQVQPRVEDNVYESIEDCNLIAENKLYD